MKILVCPGSVTSCDVPGRSGGDRRTTIGLRGFEVAAVERRGADDAVIDFEITANRPDCLSLVGLAREASAIAAACRCRCPSRRCRAPTSRSTMRMPLEVDDRGRGALPAVLPRRSPTSRRPLARLAAATASQAAGVRPINNVVDITNYVLLELGQPMHAFDLDALGGRRPACPPGARRESGCATLDGSDRTLDADMLVIADAERAQAVGRRDGRRRSPRSRRDHARSRSRARTSSPHRCAAPAERLGLKTEARRASSAAPTSTPPVGARTRGAR